MNNDQPGKIGTAFRIWLLTSSWFGTGFFIVNLFTEPNYAWIAVLATLAALAGSSPILLLLFFVLPQIEKAPISSSSKKGRLYLFCWCIIIPYAVLGGLAIQNNWPLPGIPEPISGIAEAWILLGTAASLALFSINQRLNQYFSNSFKQTFMYNQEIPQEQPELPVPASETASGKILLKALITGGLTLLMLVPSLFVTNLVTEREQRQQQVTQEISNKWSAPQTLTGPYLVLPYKEKATNEKGETVTYDRNIFLLPENLQVNGTMQPEIRPRSIYKVLLYKSQLHHSGNFQIRLPKNVQPADVNWQNAQICFGIRDFKGIVDKVSVQFNNQTFEMAPGLPTHEKETITLPASPTQTEAYRSNPSQKEIESIGLSANIPLSETQLNTSISFELPLKINGSEYLHFIPLAGNSQYHINSSWGSPNFDGNSIPGTRVVSDSGFDARWSFNKANLPFNTLLQDFDFKKEPFAFGITMVQPADHYAKTMRSVKYAILFIGLTFALFFIVELMQKKPVHPVQYALIGIALVVFFTLLLSISEFILFDFAYLIAALATVLLISAYARAHFGSTGTALLFAGLLSMLYGFIFVLIRLEDTALLVGSIGLFAVLAVVMYFSRRIQWYPAK